MISTLITEYYRLMLSETTEDKEESYSKVVDAGFQI